MLADNVSAWFEIPTTDLDRAVRFYQTVLDVELARESMDAMQMAVFPFQKPHNTGALINMEGVSPSSAGSVVYLNLSEDLSTALARVEPAGGKVEVEKTAIPGGMGYFAVFIDSEGNRVGLYSNQ